jgi:hypothetical protein
MQGYGRGIQDISFPRLCGGRGRATGTALRLLTNDLGLRPRGCITTHGKRFCIQLDPAAGESIAAWNEEYGLRYRRTG